MKHRSAKTSRVWMYDCINTRRVKICSLYTNPIDEHTWNVHSSDVGHPLLCEFNSRSLVATQRRMKNQQRMYASRPACWIGDLLTEWWQSLSICLWIVSRSCRFLVAHSNICEASLSFNESLVPMRELQCQHRPNVIKKVISKSKVRFGLVVTMSSNEIYNYNINYNIIIIIIIIIYNNII